MMRILLVEDEEKVSRFIVRGLVAERFAVDTAKDGHTGLQLATDVQYDLIILDLMLPGIGGTDILRRVRRVNPNVPLPVSWRQRIRRRPCALEFKVEGELDLARAEACNRLHEVSKRR